MNDSDLALVEKMLGAVIVVGLAFVLLIFLAGLIVLAANLIGVFL